MSKNIINKKLIYVLMVVLSIISYGYGIASYKYKLFPYNYLLYVKKGYHKGSNSVLNIRLTEFTDTTNKQEVSCDKIKKDLFVILVLGQSQAANLGETRYTRKTGVYNFFRGKCYLAKDPLVGTSGADGSVWTRFGDMVISQGLASNVLIVPTAIGASSISRWGSRGDLHDRLVETVRYLKENGLQITHIFWHQGEADNIIGTTKEEYKKIFLDIAASIRKMHIDAPIYVAISTRVKGKVSQDIRDAQNEVVDASMKIYPGPDTDLLNTFEDRYDGVHFTEAGLMKVAALWLKAIRKNESHVFIPTSEKNKQNELQESGY